MSWRVVSISSNSKIDYKMNYLVVRSPEGINRVLISEISTLIIESTGISLTAYLLCELVKNKINVIFCDEKRLPHSSLLPLYGSFDTSSKIRTQISWLQETKDFVWSEVVRAKIRGQIAVLEKCKFIDRVGLLKEYTKCIEPGDTSNREGHAAKVYFNELFGMEFSRAEEDNINSALNYGYSIILSAVAREVASSGYANQIGIFHNNVHNALNLSCDLMEPFRPFVDYRVKTMNLEQFAHDEKVTLIQVLNQQVMIDGHMQYMVPAIRVYIRSIFDALAENDVALINNPSYEL